MPIPAFDGILNVLPPHLGDPREPTDLSPFPCTVAELCDRFATSPKRKSILNGFLNFRQELFNLGLSGFQWLDGSFLEDIESEESRDPNDIDVVSFTESSMDLSALRTHIANTSPELLNRDHVKATYSVDHFLMPLGSKPALIVDNTRYWYGLFSHRRDRLWKGMLVVKLADKADDLAARTILGGKP